MMINSKEEFEKKTNCEKLTLLSNDIEKKLVDFSNGDIDMTALAIIAVKLIRGFEDKKFSEAELNCAGCYDFNNYTKLLFETIENEGNLEQLKLKLQIWAKVKADDAILYNFHFQENKFSITGTPNVQNKTFYFDFNVYQQIEDRDLFELVKSKHLTIVYSPMHLEEVFRMNDVKYQKLRMETITQITGNHIILRMSENPSIYIEEPKYSYDRVLSNIALSEAMENKRLVKNNDREIFFENISYEKFKYITDDEDVFEIIDAKDFKYLLHFAGCTIEISEFRKDNKTYDEILHMIHSLYDVLDNVAFLKDKTKNGGRAIKSATYDVEHLIFASFCDTLVTADKKMARRAIQIYRFLNIETNVIHINKLNTLELFFA